jgi:low affinity Fe/Cu permease
MKKLYIRLELVFEKIANYATIILSNSITFFIALCAIIFWFIHKQFAIQTVDETIRDLIHSLTFLSLFIIQKSFNRFSAFLHIKVNELIVSNKTADNSVIHMENKTEQELVEIVKEQLELEIMEQEKIYEIKMQHENKP